MADSERVKMIVKILEKEVKLIKNDLIKRLMGKMSRQTAINAIDDAVKSKRIIPEKALRGKLPIVWLSLTEFSKAENLLNQELSGTITGFDDSFSHFYDRYRSLSLEDRADGIDTFQYYFRSIVVILELMMESFKKTKQWTDMMEHLKSYQEEFQKLASTETKEDLAQISLYILGQHSLDTKDAFDDVKDYLTELDKKYP